MKERHGKFLTNVVIINNGANDNIIDTKGYSNARIYGYSTTEFDLQVIGSDKDTLTGDWTKVSILTKSDNHFVGTAFTAIRFDLITPNMTNTPRYLRIGNLSGGEANGVHLYYALSSM